MGEPYPGLCCKHGVPLRMECVVCVRQLADILKDELEAARRDLQSANERIEAAEKLVAQAEEYFIVAAQRIDELQSQLSALQRAAREYVDDIEADIRGIKPRDGRLLRALMDLLK